MDNFNCPDLLQDIPHGHQGDAWRYYCGPGWVPECGEELHDQHIADVQEGVSVCNSRQDQTLPDVVPGQGPDVVRLSGPGDAQLRVH